MGHGNQVVEWLEALVKIIKIWVWSLWESEGGLSVVELLHNVVSFIDVLSELI
jgi:hypothetical protein